MAVLITIPSNSETVQLTSCSGIVLNPLLILKYWFMFCTTSLASLDSNCKEFLKITS